MLHPNVLKKFSQANADSPVIFTGDLCKVRILEKFEALDALAVGDTVKTIGVFDMVVDGEVSGMFLLGRVEMKPSIVDTVEQDGARFYELTFHKGDTFIVSMNTIVEDFLPYSVWMTYIRTPNVMKAMSYQDQSFIFDLIKKTSGSGFPVDHVVYEAIFAHLSRDPNDLTLPYRNTKMDGDFKRIGLGDLAHAGRSTSSRVIGAWFSDGINAALSRPNDANSPIEDLLRQ